MTMLVGSQKGPQQLTEQRGTNDESQTCRVTNQFVWRPLFILLTGSGQIRLIKADYHNINISAAPDNPVNDRRLQQFAPAGLVRLSHHNLGDVVPTGILHNRFCYISGGNGGDLAPQALGQPQIAPDPLPILLDLTSATRGFQYRP